MGRWSWGFWIVVLCLAGACKPLPKVSDRMPDDEPAEPAASFDYRAYIDAVYNQHHPEAVKDYFTPNVTVHAVAPDAEGGAGTEYLQKLAESLIQGFPDLKITVDEVIQQGDRLAARVTLEGTHEGDFAGIKPTKKKIKVANFAVYRIEGDKIAEVWSLTDVAALMRQLGK